MFCFSTSVLFSVSTSSLQGDLFTVSYFSFLQMHVDPFEEIEMSEKNAEEHRRSATEKDVRTIVIFLLQSLYALKSLL